MLDGIALSGYRSFDEKITKIKDFKKVNIFIGKNNSGKSNILRLIELLSHLEANKKNNIFDKDLDYCVNINAKEIKYGYLIKKDSSITGKEYSVFEHQYGNVIKDIPEWANNIWFLFSDQEINMSVESRQFTKDLGDKILGKCNHDTIINLTPNLRADIEYKARNIALRIMQSIKYPQYQAYMVDAFRQIIHDEKKNNLSGLGLINKLRELQAPVLKSYKLSKKKFDKINEFIQEILGIENTRLEIPAKTNEILVSINNKVLPLESLGTGMHELIILAVAVTLYDNVIFCIEEPEIHLHPTLQKKIITYLLNNTNNQYFITTHSNSFFDFQDVSIYHCRLNNGFTECHHIKTDLQKSTVLSELGYKASDILLSNYIIWVEGPSDRVYINHWIKSLDKDIIEGLHYSIMFYGGRLLSHLAYDDPEVEEFIQLCRLNRNACIIIDSDREKPKQWLNSTKKRIIKDFNSNNSFSWVTKGRTIENYVPENVLNQSVEKVHPKLKKYLKWDQFNNMTKIKNNKMIDKVAVSRTVAKHKPDFSILDLDIQIKKLLEYIDKAND